MSETGSEVEDRRAAGGAGARWHRPSDRSLRLLAVILVALGLALTQPAQFHYDFTTYHVAGLLLVEGEPERAFDGGEINRRFQERFQAPDRRIGKFLYSPVYLLPAALSTVAGYGAAAIAAQALTLASLAVLLYLLLGAVSGWPLRALLCLVFLVGHPVTQQFLYLNWSVHLALFVALAWLETRRGRVARAALWWALAIHLKVVVVLLALPLIFAGRWRLVGAVAVAGALLVAISLPWVGVSSYAAWTGSMGHAAAAGTTPFHNKISLAATVGKLLTEPLEWVQPSGPVEHLAVRGLFWAGLAAFLTVLALRRRDLERNFGLAVPVLLLFVPQTWDHTEVLLLAVFLVPSLPKRTAALLATVLMASALYGPALDALLREVLAGESSPWAARAAFFFYPALNALAAAAFLTPIPGRRAGAPGA